MKLYYSPFACSLASHIACREANLDVELLRVELATKRIAGAGGRELFEENPMGQVPTLILDDGRLLTENVAVLSFLGRRKKSEPVTTSNSDAEIDFEQLELTRWLSFVATEIHKRILHPIFAPPSPDTVKEHARASVGKALGVLEQRLESRPTLLGGEFSSADAYLFWALTIMPHGGISLEPYPTLRKFHELHLRRPAVRAALAFERKERETPFAA